jgi:hypothetical protein
VKFVVALIALVMGGWLSFDGSRAFVAGDYVTPKTGPGAGQLGPWSKIVSAVGIDPRSSVAKGLHVALGILWLIALAALFIRPQFGWYALAATSVLSLWYLPLGTVLSVIELCLLFLPAVKSLR